MILILMMVMIVMEYFWVEVTMMEMSVGGAGDTYIFSSGLVFPSLSVLLPLKFIYCLIRRSDQ